MQWQDVRVLQVGRGLDLGQEPLGANHGGQFGSQDLERDVAVVFDIVREIDGRHAAGAEFVLDGVAVGQGCGEAVDIGHWLRAMAMGYGLWAMGDRLSAIGSRLIGDADG